MRAATLVSILFLSSIALQAGCEIDSIEGELDEQSRAFELCDASLESDIESDSDSTTRPLACELEIPTPPEGETFDPTKVNIKLLIDESWMNLPFVESESDCDGHGWYYSPNKLEPKSIVLCPSTCELVKMTEKGKIEVVFGCATEH